jgi:AMMECR1 domain-containing protein
MHRAARKAIVSYLTDSRIPTPEDVGLAGSESARSKDPVFVTLYRDGKVIASSGRIHAKQESTAKEIIENALLCLKDARFASAVRDAADMEKVSVRVDTLPASKRRVLANIDALDLRKEGVIFLAQGRGKLSVVLPGMAELAEKPSQILSIAMKKAGVDPTAIKPEEYVIYGLETVVASDF